jgi:hypothetical protein
MNPEMDSEIDSEMGDEPQTQMESKTFSFTKKQIFESFGINMDDATVSVDKHVDQKITPDTTQSRRAKPFRAPAKFNQGE